MVLPVHLEGDDHIVFDDSNAGDAEQRPSIPDPVSKLELYFHRPDHYAEKKIRRILGANNLDSSANDGNRRVPSQRPLKDLLFPSSSTR